MESGNKGKPPDSPNVDTQPQVTSSDDHNGYSDVNASTATFSGCAPGSTCDALKHAVAALYRFDDFHTEKIGAGFFSEVFKVMHRVTGDVLVLKMNSLASNRHNMLKEVQLMNKLTHPNILRFMGVCVHRGQLHALTEYIDGGSLEGVLGDRSYNLSWEDRISLAHGISAGMDYLHSKAIMHRDLTSKNVLVKHGDESREMQAVVGDFGLAAKIPCESTRLPVVGSPYWMAPECLRGEWYNEKADVFSFGIILCEMAARIEADPDVLPRTENFGLDYVALSDMVPDCPPAFFQLAVFCCRMDPKSRPSFSQLESTLRELLCGDENGTIPSSPVDSPQLALPLPIPITLQSAEENEKLTPGDTSSERSRDAVTPIRLPLGKASPRHISQVMCRLDPHYRPRSSTNPFSTLSFGTGKILATSSNLDLSSLSPSSSSADAPYPLSLLFHSLPNSPTFVRKEEEGAGKERPPEEVEGEACRCRRRGSGESGFFSVEESERVSSSTDLSPDLGLVASASLDSSSEFCDATDTRAQLFERSSSACTDSSEDASCFGEDERTSRQRDVGRIVEYFEHVRGVHEKEKRPKRITVSANVQNLLREARLHRRLPAAATSVVDNLGSTTSPVVTRVIDASSATSKGPSICKGTVKAKLELFNAKQSSSQSSSSSSS